MTIYESKTFNLTKPIALSSGDVVRRCDFKGNGKFDFALTADGKEDVLIEECSFSNLLSAVRVSKGSSRIRLSRCHVTRWRTYGFALYECADVSIDDCTFSDPIGETKKQPRQAIVAYAANTGLVIKHVTAYGDGRAHPNGTGDLIAIQHATDFWLKNVWAHNGGENGIAVCGSSRGTLTECGASGNDAHGIQIGLSPSDAVPNGLPCDAIELLYCKTRDNGRRQDGKAVSAGLYFQNSKNVLAWRCDADEPLQGAHIANCWNVKLAACSLRAPTPLAVYGPGRATCGLL